MKTTFYAVNDIHTDTKHRAEAGDAVATVEHELPLEKILAGLQTGAITTEKPKKADEKSVGKDGDAAASKSSATK